MKAIAHILSVIHDCGGQMFDERTTSYDITSDTAFLVCESCHKRVNANRLPKRASLFVE